MITQKTSNRYKDFIQKNLSDRSKFEQLAEESAELTQAALKLIRAQRLSENKTPVTGREAVKNMVEEITDVLICLSALGVDYASIAELVEDSPKWRRWAERLGYFDNAR